MRLLTQVWKRPRRERQRQPFQSVSIWPPGRTSRGWNPDSTVPSDSGWRDRGCSCWPGRHRNCRGLFPGSLSSRRSARTIIDLRRSWLRVRVHFQVLPRFRRVHDEYRDPTSFAPIRRRCGRGHDRRPAPGSGGEAAVPIGERTCVSPSGRTGRIEPGQRREDRICAAGSSVRLDRRRCPGLSFFSTSPPKSWKPNGVLGEPLDSGIFPTPWDPG